MTFEELGTSLRTEREKRNLRLEDAADALKINPRHLRALEDGDVRALPHAAYVRGFIRSYASWLGWSAEEIQEALASINGVPSTAARQKNNDYIEMPDKPEKRSFRGLILLICLLLLAGAGWWLWQAGHVDRLMSLVNHPKGNETTLQTADSYIAEKDADRARKAAENSVPTSGRKEDRENVNNYTLPVPGNLPPSIPAPKTVEPAPEPMASPEPQNVPTLPEQASASPEPTVEEKRSLQPDNHKLVITAIEECWVHSNADKTDTRQFSLRKGDTFALTFTKNLELKLGNAGGVRLRYDGEDLPAPGTSGQVRTLVFPPKVNQ